VGGEVMYSGPQWYPYIQNLHHQLHHLTERIKKLELVIENMQEEITGLKERKQFNVEKIEYRFDQLKVEQLEGTLNIGITPGHAENIEKYAVHQKEMEDLQFSQPEQQDDALFQRIYDQIDNYLQGNENSIISSLKNKYEIQLDNEYSQMMIDDVKKQLDQRIKYYLRQPKSSQQVNVDLEKQIVEQTKSDIYGALDQHFQKIKDEGD
jgi:spore germination protein PC